MKKVFSYTAASIFMMTMVMVGCKSGGSDPKSVAIAFMEKLKEKDFDGASKYATKESKTTLGIMQSFVKLAKNFPDANSDDMDFAKEWKDKKVDYSEPKIEGDVATVSLMVDGVEKMPIKLKKEDGAWKVAFDTDVLMQQEKTHMQTLPKLNTDSLIQDMNVMGDSTRNILKKARLQIDSAKLIKEK